MPQARSSSSRGFSLTEVIIAMGLLTTVSLGVAQVFALTARANYVARGQTSTTAMAEMKMEQLRSLTWGFDTEGQGLPVSDTTTNLTTDPPSTGGAGLNPSPTTSLTQNTAGYVDFLNANGAYVGTGTTAPDGAAFVRRWSIHPLPTNPNNTLILQVFVTPIANEVLRDPNAAFQRMNGDALLVSVKTRKAQ
ncbi:MAG: prepilin-type N-terminal cleavage/methylation domain-containing protein [Vicinamibacterales bacterium]